MERINATTGSYNFIDLFAGAGGLSEGFIQAGFSPVAHVEMNPYAAQTLETRTGYYYLKAQGKLDIYKDYISGKITFSRTRGFRQRDTPLFYFITVNQSLLPPVTARRRAKDFWTRPDMSSK